MSTPADVVLFVESASRVVDTPEASEVRDFARRNSYAFPSSEVLVPAPMAVSILGQLTIVATATDFKLVEPKEGFKHVHYPDSFRATIIQLVDSGALALNKSFSNFDEINKRCAVIPPSVTNIVGLLVGTEGNTQAQNDRAVERYLPTQIKSLSNAIEACLAKAKDTDQTFNDLLALVMEIHQSCAGTKGLVERQTREADLLKAFLEKEEASKNDMKRFQEQELKDARENFIKVQNQFNDAINDMPGSWTLSALGVLDVASNIANVLTLGHFFPRKPVSYDATPSHPTTQGSPYVDRSDINDPGYQKASTLRGVAETLHILLTVVEPNGSLNWNSIKSNHSGGCMDIKVQCNHVIQSLQAKNSNAGHATRKAIELAVKGKDLASTLELVVPGPESQIAIAPLTKEVTTWREEVVAFASEADLKLGSSLLGSNRFIPAPNFQSGGGIAELRVRNAQYRLAATQAQLNASRESSKAASDKLMEVNGQLSDIMARLAKIDVQQQNWEEITEILRKAIHFLCQLKTYLNNLVHFFDAVNNLVSVTLKEAADQFVMIVKNVGAIEDKAGGPEVKQVEGVSLDAWARQAIYNHALSAAKISNVVENISGMYVTLYDSNVHPGVNMLLEMGKLVGSDDSEAVTKAGKDIQDWAQGASDRIVHLISERERENQQDIENRIRELEESLGRSLPQSSESSKIKEIVDNVEEMQVQQTTQAMIAAVKANPVYGNAPS